MVALAERQQQQTPAASPSPPDRQGAMAVIRKFLYQASPEARQQGQARVELEELLESVRSYLGPQDDLSVGPPDMQTLNNVTNCSIALSSYDCTKLNVLKYRTYDGTCNNLFFPLNGAALTPLSRLLPSEYEDGLSDPVGHHQAVTGEVLSMAWPSPRLISWKVVKNSSVSVASLTHMVMQWGQFLDHDLDLSPVFDVDCGCSFSKECIPISVSGPDGSFGENTTNAGTCLRFSRSIPACRLESEVTLSRNQINQVTSYIDASQVYGSSRELALSLRLMQGGLLKQGGRLESNKGNLPFQEERPDKGVLPFFVAGDKRANEQTGLTVMHTLWLREHNRIARKLAAMNRCWDDERLYQETRKIVAAQMQKITYYDFLPTILGEYTSTYIPAYTRYNKFVDATIPNSFSAAVFRFGHSLIRDKLLRLDENFTALSIGHLDLSKAFFNPLSYFESFGTDAIARGLMTDVSNPVDEFLNEVLTTNLFSEQPSELGGDLASLNIQRGRDHGLPSYRTWQAFCQRIFPGINATFRNAETEEMLRELYGERGFEEGMDLWVGGLSESTLPGAEVGPTFACIMGLTFTRLRDGDRFWFESRKQFTWQQRRQLKQRVSLARVVCENGDNIDTVYGDVFQASSEKVSCASVPSLNLWRWLDTACSQK